ncbi:MAG TPA: hypothetical protein VIK68_11410 [Sphingomicrobium sp.]
MTTHPMDPFKIELTPKGSPVTGMDWYMSVNGGVAGGPAHYPLIQVAYNDHATLTFSLPGNSAGISFPANGADAFCAVNIKNPNGCDTADFSATVNNGQLVVVDTNATLADYKYTLTFKGAKKLDPIIKNGGGGTTGVQDFLTSPLGIAVEVAVAVLVLALIIWRVTASRRVTQDTKVD